MAISIPSGGFDPRGAGLVQRRDGTARGGETLREEIERARTGGEESEQPAVAPTRTRTVAEGRVQRVGGGAEASATNRGIASYLDVKHATLAEPFGGELVGIDIYV